MTEKFVITGMTCAACAAHVERAAASVPGVHSASVNLMLGSLVCDRDENVDPAAIVAAVTAAGYGAAPESEARRDLHAEQDAAVKAINELMQDAGVYTEVSSIDGKGLMLSAEELAKLGARLAKSGTYKQYSALYLDEIQHENGTRTELVNQNKLIKSLDGCFAGSTGSSGEAQYCGVFMVKRKGAVFIAAVIGAADSKTRFSCASKTIEASAAAVSIKTPVKKGDKVVENVSVYGGIAKNVNLVAAEDVTLIVWNGDEPRSVINAEEAYTAPVRAGDKAGTLEYIFEISGESVSIDLVFDGDVDTAGLADYVVLCFTKWVHV